jgi:hypothetical protein
VAVFGQAGSLPYVRAGALANHFSLSGRLAMKRLLVVFAVLVPLSFFVAGCGGTGGPSGKTATEPTQDQKQQMMKAKMEMEQKGKVG